MRAISSAASISIHAAVAAAFLFGTAKSAHPQPEVVSVPMPWVFPLEHDGKTGSGTGIAGPDIRIPGDPPTIPPPLGMPQAEALIRPAVPTDWLSTDRSGSGEPVPWSPVAETSPEVLAGPLPAYPDLLRQAGVEGQVVLEARVDTTGRVQRGSVVVVSATHPGFVEPARQALLATLFRPARVNGRAVPMLIRVPFAFSIRGGTGHAR